MIVARDINVNLQCYQAWYRRGLIDDLHLAGPLTHQDLDFENPDTSYRPISGKAKPGVYQASSGLASSSASATIITGEGSLA